MSSDLKKISKYLSFILRHRPEDIGLNLDNQGWASVQELIQKSVGFDLTEDLIRVVVETNDKQRFCLSDDFSKIRANQGHSIAVDLDLTAVEPPEILYHGTAERFWNSIQQSGLQKQTRHHVHLSETMSTAMAVGSRYGKPRILKIAAKELYLAGGEFFKTANNVWLVESVPIEYISE